MKKVAFVSVNESAKCLAKLLDKSSWKVDASHGTCNRMRQDKTLIKAKNILNEFEMQGYFLVKQVELV